jgi:hypothetical protein
MTRITDASHYPTVRLGISHCHTLLLRINVIWA